MSDEPTDTPGSSAADSAPSTRIPRLDSTDKGRPRKSGGAKPLTAGDYTRNGKSSGSKTAVIPAVKSGTATDSEAEARTIPAAKKSAPAKKSASAKTASAKKSAPEAKSSAPAKPAATFEPDPTDTMVDAPAVSERSRSASLRLTHIEPWSVTRMAFVISVAMMIVGVVAMTIFWAVLEMTGVWDQLSDSVTSVLSDDANAFDVTDYLGFGRLIGLSIVISALNVVVTTALATIAAHLYNLAAGVIGGLQVTFNSDR